MRRLTFFLLLLVVSLEGAVTGKIVGRVVDKETGEPLPMVNVVVSGTERGTSSGDDGYFFLLDLEAGDYTLEFSFIGYGKVTLQRVRVNPDRTTFLDVALAPTAVEVEPVVITAEPPLVEKDITWKVARVKESAFRELPIFDTKEALATQVGVTLDAFGELHIRGGRSGELLYLIDGMPVNDPITGDYEGLLDREALREMELYSGAFSAEYGRALSGVVNLVTNEGTGKLSIRSEILGPPLYTFKREGSWFLSTRSRYRRTDAFGEGWDALRDEESGASKYKVQDIMDLYDLPFLGELRLSGGGVLPLLPSLRFFLSGLYSNEESPLPFGFTLNRSLFLKASRDVLGFKASFSLERSKRKEQGYSHSWKYLPEHYPVSKRDIERYSLSLRRLLGKSSSFEAIFGFQKREGLTSVDELLPDQYESPARDPENLEFYITGDYPLYRKDRSKTLSLNSRFSKQWGHHQLILGGELLSHKIYLKEDSKLYIIGFIGDWLRQEFERSPREGALFLQDKIEFKHFLANVGLRWDFQDPRAKMWSDPRDPLSPLVTVPMKKQLSPRFGLAFPVTEISVLHFSYGHFYEPAPYETYYSHPEYVEDPDLMPELALIGNPALNPQKTIAYEVGFASLIGENSALDFTVYAKDIWDLLSVKEVINPPYRYTVYETADFASVRGFDVTLKMRREKRFSLILTYTFQIALGNHSFPTQAFYDVYQGLPEQQKEYALDFDRRHTLNLTLNANLPGDFLLGTIINFSSGLPYTPYVTTGLVPEPNSARMPPTLNWDLLLRKHFDFQGIRASFFLQIRNLLDRRNPLFVYNTTGDPWDPGERRTLGIVTDDYARNPSNVGYPRRIFLGLRLKR